MTLKHESPLQGYHPSIGGAAGDGTHGGNQPRPKGMPSRADCDYVVSNETQLEKHLGKDGVSIYLDAAADVISLKGIENVTLGSGVELVGQFCDPNVPGRGTVLHQPHYARHTFKIGYGNEPPTLWGVSLQGPMLAQDWDAREGNGNYPAAKDVYFDPRSDSRTHNGELDPSDWYASGLFCHTRKAAGTFRAIGCEFFGWSLAALELGSKERETKAEIRRCSFHNNLMETYGYGAEIYNGHVDFSRCYFDRNRHGISAFGYPTVSYTVRESLVGDGEGAGHAFDMHDLGANISTDTPNMGGKFFSIENCTIMMTQDIAGYGQEGIAQRGQSKAGRAFYDDADSDPVRPGDEITHCHFYHPSAPTPVGDQGDAYREGGNGNSWTSLNPHDNVFGPEQSEATLREYGAPRADGAPDVQTRVDKLRGNVSKIKEKITKLEKMLNNAQISFRRDATTQ